MSAPRNRGATTLRTKRRRENPMSEFDRLPGELREWLAAAKLPWRPRSVQQAYSKALMRTTDAATALRELDRLEQRLVAKDARAIWGHGHPDAEV